MNHLISYSHREGVITLNSHTGEHEPIDFYCGEDINSLAKTLLLLKCDKISMQEAYIQITNMMSGVK